MRGSVNGYVVRPGDRRPVANASIAIVSGPGPAPDMAPLTDHYGRFALDGLQAGRWVLRALGPESGQGEAEVPVFDNAVSDVTIELDGLRQWLADALSGIQDGTADVASGRPSARDTGPPDKVPEEKRSQAARRVASDLTSEMAGSAQWLGGGEKAGAIMPGSLRGRVVRADTGEPVANAGVNVVRGSAPAPDIAPLTDAAGRFALDGLHPGVWLLRAFGPAGETGEAEVRVRDHLPASIVIEVTGGSRLTGTILGRVLRADSGMPVADVSVELLRDGQEVIDCAARTDAAGRFSMEGITEGTYGLRAGIAGGEVGESEVSVVADMPVHAIIELGGKAGASGRVEGRVVRADTENPVPNATVSVVRGPGATPETTRLTDEAGRFCLGDLADGVWVLRAIGDAGEQGDAAVHVRSGDRHAMTIRLGGPTLLNQLLGRELRIDRAGDGLTEDFNPERVNVQLDPERRIILDIWFG